MRKPFVAGNWKMNTTSASAVELIEKLAQEVSDIARNDVDTVVYPPFVYLQSAARTANSTGIVIGAQNIYFEQKGAFTGEINAEMLKDIGCIHVLCGHSERRHVIGENDELINKKVSAAISGGLLPTLCVGELLEERQEEKTQDVVTRQIKAGLTGLDSEKMRAVTIAYEPVWAIGTGLTATTEQAQQVHVIIRQLLAEMYDAQTAEEIRIQYGGSVKAENAAELMAQKDIDGLLVGGASLKSDSFAAIIKASK